MTTQPIDPTLLSLLCRMCSETREEWCSREEVQVLLRAGLATHESHCGLTTAGADYLVRALRLSELRGKWLEARHDYNCAVDRFDALDSSAESKDFDLALGVLGMTDRLRMEAENAYLHAGGVV